MRFCDKEILITNETKWYFFQHNNVHLHPSTSIIYIYILHDGLIAQSVRASEWNSVVMGSNPTQAKFLELLQRILW